MKFSNQLDASMVPEWRLHYMDYKALKKKLKQAKAAGADAVDFLAASPQTTSLSVARSFAAGSPRHPSAVLQDQQQQQQPDSRQQQQQFFTAYGLAPFGTAQEQFLQMLQQDLGKVRDFIHSQAARVSASLEALAAAAPQLAQQDWQRLEAEAQHLGRQLLALDQFINLNQTGFVKIVKKHDKWLPDSPVWHLYLHHLQRTPWLEESHRQFMWAALSSCYYHLHAGILAVSRSSSSGGDGRSTSQAGRGSGSGRRSLQQQPQQQQRGGRVGPPAAGGSFAGSTRSSRGAAFTAAGPEEPARASKGFLPSLGSAVAGAATAAVAGAATAVAGAATAVAGAATAVAGAAAAASSSMVTEAGTAMAGQQQQQQQRVSGVVPTVNLTRKFWVSQEDVSAVMYHILQHLPLLPSTAHSASSDSSRQQQQQAGFGTQRQQQQQQQSCGLSHQHLAASGFQQQQHQRLQEFAGFTTTVHTVYFDNKGLELYHGRLYLRPNTQTLKARWIGHDDGCWAPARVVLERKIYKEGWKGESNVKNSLLIAGDVLPSYLVGTYCLGDALSQLYELPGLQQTLQQTLLHLQQRRQQRQAAQQRQQQLMQLTPFAAVSAAAAAAAASGGGSAASDPAFTGSSVTGPGVAAAVAADVEVAGAVAAAGIRVPQGVVLGSSFSYSQGSGSLGGSSQQWRSSGGGSVEYQQQQQTQQQQQLHASSSTAGKQAQCEPHAVQQQQGGSCGSGSQPDQQQQQQPLQLRSQLSEQLQQQPQQQQEQLCGVLPPHLQRTSAGAAAAAAAHFADSSCSEDDDSDDEEVQFSGGSSSRRSMPATASSSSSSSSAAAAAARSGTGCTLQQQQHHHHQQQPGSDGPQIDAAAEGGFEDAYLDPPMPSADQLSLFTEVQRLIGRKRLQPALHCVLQRMLFAMPFDARVKITLDTDVSFSAVAHYQLLQEPPVADFPSAAAPLAAAAAAAAAAVSGGHSTATDGLSGISVPVVPSPAAAAAAAAAGSSSAAPIFQAPQFDDATLAAEDAAYDTWESIFSGGRVSAGSALNPSSSSRGQPLTYHMPYALLKVSLVLPAGQSLPGWLLQLMDSEQLLPVEDWSKFVHGCAVLLPEVVRAVPYWIDDPVVDLSVQAIQAEVEAAVSTRQELLKQAARAAAANARAAAAASAAGRGQQPESVRAAERQQPQHGRRSPPGRHSSTGSAGGTAEASSGGGGASNLLARLASGVSSLIPGAAAAVPTENFTAQHHGAGGFTDKLARTSSGGFSNCSSSGGVSASRGIGVAPLPLLVQQQQQQQPGSPTWQLQPPAGGSVHPQQLFRQRSSGSRLRHSSSGGGATQLGGLDAAAAAAAAASGGCDADGASSSAPLSTHVTWAGGATRHVQGISSSSAGSGSDHVAAQLAQQVPLLQQQQQQQGSRCSASSTPRSSAAGASESTAAAAGVGGGASGLWSSRGRQLVRRISSLLGWHQKEPPLFRPEGRSPQRGWRAHRWGHPVQLLECREFFYSEAIFLDWLRVAITMASVAVLLLGYSAVAYVTPLKRPVLHIAELISLLLLPCSCVMAGYAIRVYVWRSKRLHSMRYRRVDDQLGPLMMTAVFVVAMLAVFLVNAVDLLLILKYEAKRAGRDDEEGGQGPEPAEGTNGRPLAAADGLLAQLRLL